MKYDFQLLFLLVVIGLVARRVNWKGWLSIGALIFVWMMYNWWKA